ncbi:MAG: hypothetical protein IKN89_08285 [Oscillospiraceae bacterium]|nr:hypothetical protein [Oscillospiraceae bacterium]
MDRDWVHLALREQIFSRADSDLFLFEEDDREGLGIEKGLWLGVSVPDGAARREGLLRLVPTQERRPFECSISATPQSVELAAGDGQLTIVMDSADAMRIYGTGLGIMIHKEMPVMSLETITEVRPGIADYNLFVPTGGGGHLVFSSISGSLTVDRQTKLTAGGVNQCTIWIEPGKDGHWEALVTCSAPMPEMPKPRSMSEAKEAAAQAFERFTETVFLSPKRSADSAFLLRCAYALWIARRKGKANENSIMRLPMFCRSRMTDSQCSSRQQPVFALAIRKQETSESALTSVFPFLRNGMLPEAICTTKLRYAHFPLLHAYVLSRVLNAGTAPDKERAADLYGVFRQVLEQVMETHSFSAGRLSSLNQGELSIPASAPAGACFPLETPELYTRMIFWAEMIGRLERLAEKGSGVSWYTLSRSWLAILTEELWDGAAFCCRETATGRLLQDDSLLARYPLLLGLRLPETILSTLAEELFSPRFLGDHGLASLATDNGGFREEAQGRGAVDLMTNGLYVLALRDARRHTQADKLAELLLRDAQEQGPAPLCAFYSGEREPVRPGDGWDAASAAMLIAIAEQ